MKKLLPCFLLILTFVLTGCKCEIVEQTSLDKYKEEIARSGGLGFSDFETDHAEELLPSLTFLDDYVYTDSTFYFYEHKWLFWCNCDEKRPYQTLIVLQYEEEIYLEAKACVLENIPVYQDRYYTYNDFHFMETRTSVTWIYRVGLRWWGITTQPIPSAL